MENISEMCVIEVNEETPPIEFQVLRGIIWEFWSRLLLIDLLIVIPLAILFGDFEVSQLISQGNMVEIIEIFGYILLATGFIVLLLYAIPSQRIASLGRATSEWGRSHGGPSKYSEEIIKRQMSDWPRIIAGLLNLILAVVILAVSYQLR